MKKPHSCFDCEHLDKSINAEPCMDCIYGCYWSPKEEDKEENDNENTNKNAD